MKKERKGNSKKSEEKAAQNKLDSCYYFVVNPS
jgi:hypothetical protein